MLMVLLAEALEREILYREKTKHLFKCIIQKHAFLASEQLPYRLGTWPWMTPETLFHLNRPIANEFQKEPLAEELNR